MSEDVRQSKSEIIEKFRQGAEDTGSPEVQIALLTNRIEALTGHFGKHHKDHHSRLGMLKLISRRKNLLKYLRRESTDRYKSTLGALGLRK